MRVHWDAVPPEYGWVTMNKYGGVEYWRKKPVLMQGYWAGDLGADNLQGKNITSLNLEPWIEERQPVIGQVVEYSGQWYWVVDIRDGKYLLVRAAHQSAWASSSKLEILGGDTWPQGRVVTEDRPYGVDGKVVWTDDSYFCYVEPAGTNWRSCWQKCEPHIRVDEARNVVQVYPYGYTVEVQEGI